MKKPGNFTLLIHYTNGSKDELPFESYSDARYFYRHSISYSGGRVKRVEIDCHDRSHIAIWDSSWDEISQQAGLIR